MCVDEVSIELIAMFHFTYVHHQMLSAEQYKLF